jgi:hypothetical protein
MILVVILNNEFNEIFLITYEIYLNDIFLLICLINSFNIYNARYVLFYYYSTQE